MENNFAQQLSQLRRQRQLSQEQLASQVFVSRQAISKWEQGETTPDLTTLLQLADLLQVDLNELVTGHSAQPQSGEAPQLAPVQRGMNGWEFLARYWWAVIGLVAVIGSFFSR